MMNQYRETLDIFRRISENPYEYGKSVKESTGKPVIGYFCTYAPEELIHAAGALPFRILSSTGRIERAEAHLQSYCCSLVRGGLEDALTGRLGFLDGAVFPHTCDSIQRLSDIWRLNAGFGIHIDTVLPVKLNAPSAHKYMIDVMHTAVRDLEHALGKTITEDEIAASVFVYNRIRKSLMSLYSKIDRHPWIMEADAMYHILRAVMVMDRDEAASRLEDFVRGLEDNGKPAGKPDRKRILLAGGICSHPDIYRLLHEAGGDIVSDDLCTGRRYADGLIDETQHPVEALAQRSLGRMVCPAKHVSVTARGVNLFTEVTRKRIDGVIFLQLKFCDPHAFDYPYLKDCLDREKVASMLLEIEQQPSPEGQLRTRFETFVEML